MTLQEQRDIIQAAIDGKRIERRQHGGLGAWSASNPALFNFGYYEYRAKPEPREWWLNIYPSFNSDIVHKTKEAANAGALPDRQELIKVREVLPSP